MDSRKRYEVQVQVRVNTANINVVALILQIRRFVHFQPSKPERGHSPTRLGKPVSLPTNKRLASLVFALFVNPLVLVFRCVPCRRGVLARFLRRGADGIGTGRLVTRVVSLGEGFLNGLPPADFLEVRGAIGVDGLLREVVGSGASWEIMSGCAGVGRGNGDTCRRRVSPSRALKG